MASNSPKVPHKSANTADLFGSTTKPSDQIDGIAAVQASHPDRSATESGRAPSGTHQVSNYLNDAAVEAHRANLSRVVVVNVGPNDTPLVNTVDATTVIAMSDSGKKRTPLEFSVLETRPADVLAVAIGSENTKSAAAHNPGELRGQSTEPDWENGELFKAAGVCMMPHVENPDHKKLAKTDRPDCFVGGAASQELDVLDPVSYVVVPSNHSAPLVVADHLVEGGRVADQAGVAAMKTGDMSGEINHSEPPPAATDFVLDEFAKLPKTDSGVVRTGFVLPRED